MYAYLFHSPVSAYSQHPSHLHACFLATSEALEGRTEERRHFTVITVCNRQVTEYVGLCMQKIAGFRAERVTSVFYLGFGFKKLELDHLITHVFERTPPIHEMAVRPITIFGLTFKVRHMGNRVPGTNNLITVTALKWHIRVKVIFV